MWCREDTAAADVREHAMTRGYDNAATSAIAPPTAVAPPPMAAPPPAGGAMEAQSGRYLGAGGAGSGSVASRYVNLPVGGGGFGQ